MLDVSSSDEPRFWRCIPQRACHRFKTHRSDEDDRAPKLTEEISANFSLRGALDSACGALLALLNKAPDAC
jgi:hypothetical protein